MDNRHLMCTSGIATSVKKQLFQIIEPKPVHPHNISAYDIIRITPSPDPPFAFIFRRGGHPRQSIQFLFRAIQPIHSVDKPECTLLHPKRHKGIDISVNIPEMMIKCPFRNFQATAQVVYRYLSDAFIGNNSKTCDKPLFFLYFFHTPISTIPYSMVCKCMKKEPH